MFRLSRAQNSETNIEIVNRTFDYHFRCMKVGGTAKFIDEPYDLMVLIPWVNTSWKRVQLFARAKLWTLDFKYAMSTCSFISPSLDVNCIFSICAIKCCRCRI